MCLYLITPPLWAICLLPTSIFLCNYYSKEFIWFCNHCLLLLQGISFLNFLKVDILQLSSNYMLWIWSKVIQFLFLSYVLIFFSSLMLKATISSLLILFIPLGQFFFLEWIILTSCWTLWPKVVMCLDTIQDLSKKKLEK